MKVFKTTIVSGFERLQKAQNMPKVMVWESLKRVQKVYIRPGKG